MSKKILLTTIGTYGDFSPYLVLANLLSSKGHKIFFATQSKYKDEVIAFGHEFIELLPSWEKIETEPEILKKIYHPKTGSEYLLKEQLIPSIRRNFEILKDLDQKFDIVFNNTLTLSTALYCKYRNIKLISVVLSPISYFSPYDPPILPVFKVLNTINKIPLLAKLGFKLADGISKKWLKCIDEIAHEFNIEKSSKNPLTYGYFESDYILNFFPSFLLRPQIDWPKNFSYCGFPYKEDNIELSQEISEFIKTDKALYIYTLGSSFYSKDFFELACLKHQDEDCHVLLITGENDFTTQIKHIKSIRSIPYHLVFPHAELIIHQGGIGTVAECIRAGIPQVIMPTVNDQFECASRAKKLGIAIVLNIQTKNLDKLSKFYQEAIKLKPRCLEVQKMNSLESFDNLVINALSEYL